MRKNVLALVVFAWGFWLSAADLAYPVFPLKAAPAMDGKGDGEAWADIPAAVGFTSIKTGAFVQTRRTAFKMGWLGQDLYVQVRCDEPEPDKVKVDENNYRDGWYPDDNLEFFFSSDKASNKGVKQFLANSRGARWCNFVAPAGAAPWAVAAARGTDNWSVEMKIPFSQLGVGGDFKSGKYWFNVARSANDNPDNDKWSCFAPVQSGFGDAANFAALSFKDAPTPEQLAQARQDLNRLDKWVRERLWKIGNVREAFLADGGDLGAFMALKQKAKAVLADKSLVGASELINEYDRQAAELAAPVKKVVLQVEARDAAVKLYLDGKELRPDASGKFPARLKEGLSTLAAECVASGAAPSARICVEGLPETASRWKVSAKDEKDWKEVKFNDEKWAAPKALDGGFLWSANPDAKIRLRQTLLWESKPFGKFLCLNPPVKEWLFSEGSAETLFLSLYPLLPFAPENYEFVLDVPEGFELLDMPSQPSNYWCGVKNVVPKSVKKEDVKREGMNYLRYRIAFDKKDVPKDTTFFTMLPVKLNQWASAGKRADFHFRRLSDGNFTELEQTLPVGVLPPINGRTLKRTMISQYCGSPYFGAALSGQHLKEMVKASVAAGLNYWMVGPTWDNKRSGEFQKLLVDSGASLVLGYRNHPLWGCGDNKDKLYQTLQREPGTRAQYFNNTKTWDKNGMYCPSWAVGEGREQFKNAVRDDYAACLAKWPMETELVWANWEGFPWVKSDGWSTAAKGDESYCFCPRCKKEFVRYAGLPEGTVLSDDEIFKNHYKKWFDFRSGLDGQIQGVVRDALAEVGKKYMVYSQTQQHEFWAACKGNVDHVFLGCPGNGTADAKQQEHMDTAMKFFEDNVGLRQLVGQRFVSFGAYYVGGKGKGGPLRFNVMSRDGYIDAKSWKPQVLRVAASLHGGVDMQSSVECAAGILYYIGEATRAIDQYEGLFHDGKREDSLASSAQIKYPNLLVLTSGDERLVLLFNEGDKPLEVELENKGLKAGQTATIWETPGEIDNPGRMKVTIPPGDVALVHIEAAGWFPWLRF